MDGFSLCQWIRSQPDGDQHLILVGTTSDRKEDLQKILDAGADDYITKPYQADALEVRLVIAQQRVRNIETRARLEASLRQERERLHYLATHDSLTKLLNRAIPEIDRQVINKALSHLRASNALHLAINLSGQSFADQSLADFIEASFKAAQVEPCRVTFEITETAMISNLAAARAMMRQLSGYGFRFALDDFGAGFSSFSYLKELIPNYLKIDGSFIRDAENDQSKWIFVEMMNDIAHRLKIKSIAEFVAMETTLGKLRQIGVDLGQGFLFGEPGPPPGLVSFG
jgi:EAL domain-containing protein (putative c-di-GMP-specific phosphodiesterase class I)